MELLPQEVSRSFVLVTGLLLRFSKKEFCRFMPQNEQPSRIKSGYDFGLRRTGRKADLPAAEPSAAVAPSIQARLVAAGRAELLRQQNISSARIHAVAVPRTAPPASLSLVSSARAELARLARAENEARGRVDAASTGTPAAATATPADRRIGLPPLPAAVAAGAANVARLMSLLPPIRGAANPAVTPAAVTAAAVLAAVLWSAWPR